MKIIYFLLFLSLSFFSYGQESKADINGFKLYPNPVTTGVVYITTSLNQSKIIKIYDVFGELVLSNRIDGKALDISRLSPGVYVVQVTEEDKTINRKLVVK